MVYVLESAHFAISYAQKMYTCHLNKTNKCKRVSVVLLTRYFPRIRTGTCFLVDRSSMVSSTLTTIAKFRPCEIEMKRGNVGGSVTTQSASLRVFH